MRGRGAAGQGHLTSTRAPSAARPAPTRPPIPALFDDIRERVRHAPPEAKARGYRAGPLLLQRQGRPLRGLRRRRPGEDRDALPAGYLRALRCVQGQALQPGNAGGTLQGQEHLRSAGYDRGGGDGVLRKLPQRSAASCRPCTTWAWAISSWASPPPPCPAARPSASSWPPS